MRTPVLVRPVPQMLTERLALSCLGELADAAWLAGLAAGALAVSKIATVRGEPGRGAMITGGRLELARHLGGCPPSIGLAAVVEAAVRALAGPPVWVRTPRFAEVAARLFAALPTLALVAPAVNGTRVNGGTLNPGGADLGAWTAGRSLLRVRLRAVLPVREGPVTLADGLLQASPVRLVVGRLVVSDRADPELVAELVAGLRAAELV